MDLVCPLCNGLVDYNVSCPKCGSEMSDEGRVVDYLDDYSPYLSDDITQRVDGAPHNQCMHLFECKVCNNDKRIAIYRIKK